MDTFLKTYSLPTVNQKDSENLNRQIITGEIEAVIKKLPTNKCTGTDVFTGEFYQLFKEEITLIILKPSQNSRGGKASKLIFKELTLS